MEPTGNPDCGPERSDGAGTEGQPIVWRLHLRASRETVYHSWLSVAEHPSFWCERSRSEGKGFELTFINGHVEHVRILRREPSKAIGFTYFGSHVTLEFEEHERGTDLCMTNDNVPRQEWEDVNSGWLNVLLPFKAWVDFGIDLRNHDVTRTLYHRFADQ